MSGRIPSDAPILTAQEMRDAEQRWFDAGNSQAEAMERAGAAVAREAARFIIGRPVLVLAGPGNNGGDAYVAARLLREAGHDVCVAALGGKDEGAAATMRDRWQGETVPFDQAKPRPVLIDGLFGTGLSRPLSSEVKNTLHDLVNEAEFCISIDLPSGLGTDDGSDLGAASVEATVALGSLKPAHLLGHGLQRCGHVLLADIGIPVQSGVRSLGRPRLYPPAIDAHKYSRGMVLVIEGDMPGASRLCARAALHGGAGYVMVAGTGSAEAGPDALVHVRVDDADALRKTLDDDRIGAVVIGPGLGRSDAARAKLDMVMGSDHRVIFDGDALTLMGEEAAQRLAKRKALSVLTPHSGEFARMFDADDGGKIAITRHAAAQSGSVVVHKGPDTVIADANGVIVANSGSSWLSTAGTGDVLAGLVGARISADGNAAQAVWLHGRAAQLAGPAFAADDLIAHIAPAMKECL